MYQIYFIDVILKQYLDFSGRTTRKQYWLFVLFHYLTITILWFTFWKVAWLCSHIFLVVPAFAIWTRRLRDAGLLPWWIISVIIPYIISLDYLPYELLKTIVSYRHGLIIIILGTIMCIGQIICLIALFIPSKQYIKGEKSER